jgi:hypothetical protein
VCSQPVGEGELAVLGPNQVGDVSVPDGRLFGLESGFEIREQSIPAHPQTLAADVVPMIRFAHLSTDLARALDDSNVSIEH